MPQIGRAVQDILASVIVSYRMPQGRVLDSLPPSDPDVIASSSSIMVNRTENKELELMVGGTDHLAVDGLINVFSLHRPATSERMCFARDMSALMSIQFHNTYRAFPVSSQVHKKNGRSRLGRRNLSAQCGSDRMSDNEPFIRRLEYLTVHRCCICLAVCDVPVCCSTHGSGEIPTVVFWLTNILDMSLPRASSVNSYVFGIRMLV